jgi:hypothetical protein
MKSKRKSKGETKCRKKSRKQQSNERTQPPQTRYCATNTVTVNRQGDGVTNGHKNPFETLPNELILNIFMFLDIEGNLLRRCSN